jgi:hypothetical protein
MNKLAMKENPPPLTSIDRRCMLIVMALSAIDFDRTLTSWFACGGMNA